MLTMTKPPHSHAFCHQWAADLCLQGAHHTANAELVQGLHKRDHRQSGAIYIGCSKGQTVPGTPLGVGVLFLFFPHSGRFVWGSSDESQHRWRKTKQSWLLTDIVENNMLFTYGKSRLGEDSQGEDRKGPP